MSKINHTGTNFCAYICMCILEKKKDCIPISKATKSSQSSQDYKIFSFINVPFIFFLVPQITHSGELKFKGLIINISASENPHTLKVFEISHLIYLFKKYIQITTMLYFQTSDNNQIGSSPHFWKWFPNRKYAHI